MWKNGLEYFFGLVKFDSVTIDDVGKIKREMTYTVKFDEGSGNLVIYLTFNILS